MIKDQMVREKFTRKFFLETLLCCLGGIIYGVSINLFVVPQGLYIGNITGIAQILLHLIKLVFPAFGTGAVNGIGITMLMLNIPALYVCFRYLGRTFFIKTIATVVVQTLALMFIPMPTEAILPDALTSCLVGAAIGGLGVGLTLKNGGSGGGLDVFGVFFTLRKPHLSVGKVSIMISVVVWIYAAIVSTFPLFVYSVLFMFIHSFVIDKSHPQNIKIGVMIMSQVPEVKDYILKDLRRQATCWEGKGAYSGRGITVYQTVLSKYELLILQRDLKHIDPHAFVLIQRDIDISGFFEVRL